MKQCLAAGYPFVFGFSVYSSFESKAVAKTGKVPLPKRNESQLGGHAVMCVGFRDKDQVWIVRNSWGSGWGDKGYCYFPYQYLTDPSLCSDLWTVRLV
jgi:C1A family cysteine protease